MRYQRLVAKVFDAEFKRFMLHNGYNISTASFEVVLNAPINLATYRRAELDAKLITTYLPLNDLPYMAKQTILQKMGFEQKDIVQNEELLRQELGMDINTANSTEQASLQSVGIEAPNNSEQDLGVDENGELESADKEYQDSQETSNFNPNGLGDSF